MKWDVIQPAELANFESLARKLRYQALGQACLEHGVSKLLLAHHQDDNVETIIQRIANSQYGTSLAGMASAAQLPHNEGKFGVYESGHPRYFSRKEDESSEAHERTTVPGSQHWTYESGGVSMLRPLLPFSKQQLVDTCETARVAWHEDHTNHDPTFTMRNAIRHLIHSEKLPRALSKAKLLGMQTRIKILQDQKINTERNLLLSSCIVRGLDLRTGTLHIWIPTFQTLFGKSVGRSQSLADAYDMCCRLLKHLIDLVSPKEIVSASQIGRVVSLVFDGFAELSSQFRHQTAATISGVSLRRVPSAIKRGGHTLWQLSRQSWSEFEKPTAITSPAAQLVSSDMTSAGGMTIRLSNSAQRSQSSLWDGRYWLDIKSPHEVRVDCLDITQFRHWAKSFPCCGSPRRSHERHADARARSNQSSNLMCLQCPRNTHLEETIRKLENPGAVPAIVVPAGSSWNEEPGTVIALPTFGIVHPKYREVLRCDVRYKYIDTLPLGLRPHRTRLYLLESGL